MFLSQVQAKRFLKVKIRLPTPHANHKINETKLKEIRKSENITPLFSHINPENKQENFLPDLNNLEEVKLPFQESHYSELHNKLFSLFGNDLVAQKLPANLLVSYEFFLKSRLPQPFIRYSNNKSVETTGNNAHFSSIGKSYFDLLSEKYTQKLNINKISQIEPFAVLGFLHMFNYNAGKFADFESKLIDIIKV
ncbi:uncharacterized protein HGUI_00310 [Hanseniaspora guilliermondii]|uniref:Uncharacterized protein n=1 Tax=Hanseniaspora guilliermondii TaxID=56406 RepID=A0A1L0FES9_9ASCO|nr:uncharacterized protein HGUI_00310 [Hanseniaspora guilliermondii]